MDVSARLTPDQRANLVAYLDGELDERAQHEIEKTLSGSAVARHEVDMLERAWELLDELPRTTVSPEFTQRTLSSIRVDDFREPMGRRDWVRKAGQGALLLGWAAGLAGMAVLGFLAANRWVPTPTDDLVQHLPMIENFELYSDVGDVEFLRELRRTGLFQSDVKLQLPPGGANVDGDAYRARLDRIDNMSQENQEQLRQNFEEFKRLTPTQRRQYETLEHSLQADAASGGELLKVANSYENWLDDLQSIQRLAIRSEADFDERMEIVRQLKQQPNWGNFDFDRPLPPFEGRLGGPPSEPGPRRPPLGTAELEAMIDVIAANLELSDAERTKLDALSGVERRLRVTILAAKQVLDNREEDRPPSLLDAESKRKLVALVEDPQLRERLRAAGDDEGARREMERLIIDSVYAESFEEFRKRSPSESQLEQFLAGMPSTIRDQIRDMPRPRQKTRLLQAYYMRRPDPFATDFFQLHRLLEKLSPHEPPPGGRRDDDRDRRPPSELDAERPGVAGRCGRHDAVNEVGSPSLDVSPHPDPLPEGEGTESA